MNGQPRQIQVNITEQDTIQDICLKCGNDLFDIAYRHRTLPKVSMKNPTGHDMPVKIEVFVCRSCGTELGKEGVGHVVEELGPKG